jgi:hypothetical protein
MRHTMLAMLAPVVLLAGCGTDSTDAPLATEPSLSSATKIISISGRCEGTFELTSIDFLPPPLEDLAAHAYIRSKGTCRLTHLGRTKTFGRGVIDFTVDPFIGTGTRVFVAANGDKLRMTEISSTPAPGPNPEFTSTSTLTITGGTGRFRGAEGSVQLVGGGSSEIGTNFSTISGAIRLDR